MVRRFSATRVALAGWALVLGSALGLAFGLAGCRSESNETGAASSAEASGGGSEDAGRVVLYSSADEYILTPIAELFEEQTGIDVEVVGDTEATKTTGLVQRLRSEQDRPRADVFWSSEVFLTIQLADEGIFRPIPTQIVAGWPERFVGEETMWVGFGRRARVCVYNRDRVDAAEAPQTMTDLLDERWRGRVVIARPAFGTTRGHMAALVELWGAEATERYLDALAANGVRVLDGNSAVVRAVATGQADVGLTDTDDVWSGQRNGWPVDLTYIRHDVPNASGPESRIGAMTLPNTAALIAGGPNADNAERLVEFLFSEDVERALAESASRNIPVRATVNEAYPDLVVPDVASIDFRAVSEEMAQAMEIVDRTLPR